MSRGSKAGVFDRPGHRADAAVAVFAGRSDVVAVARETVAGELRIDARAARLGVFEFFEHDDAGAFAEHKAIALFIERARCALGVVVARRQRAHVGEAGHAQRRHRRFGTASEHHVRVAVLNGAQG